MPKFARPFLILSVEHHWACHHVAGEHVSAEPTYPAEG